MSTALFYVTNNQNEGPGSLRHAIEQANGLPNSQVIITPSVSEQVPILLSSPLIISGRQLSVLNLSHKQISLSGQNLTRLFSVTASNRYFLLQGSAEVLVESNLQSTDCVRKNQCETGQLILTNGSADNGGAIHCLDTLISDGILVVTQTTFCQNLATTDQVGQFGQGGAVYTNRHGLFYHCCLHDNSASYQGGAIYASNGLTLIKSKICRNRLTVIDSAVGGAGLFLDAGDLICQESQINYNSLAVGPTNNGGSGGGVVVISGNVYLTESSIDHNQAANIGGISIATGQLFVTDHSSISHNTSSNQIFAQGGGGGGVSIGLGTVYLANSQVSHNRAVGMYAGGIVSLLGAITLAEQSKVQYNSNHGPGAIACNFDGVINITGGSQVSHNTAASLGGGIVNFSLSLGAVCVSGDSRVCHNTLTNAQTIRQTIENFLSVINGSLTVLENQAKQSGGSGSLYFLHNVLPVLQTQAQNKANDLQTLVPTVIDGYATDKLIAGGGIATLLSCPILITEACQAVCHNSVGQNVNDQNAPFSALGGGVFALFSKVKVANAGLSHNKLLTTGNGGGLFIGTALSATNTTLTKNSLLANQFGAGIYARAEADYVNVINSRLSKNTAKQNGAQITCQGKRLTLTDSLIKNESASYQPINVGLETIYVNINSCIRS